MQVGEVPLHLTHHRSYRVNLLLHSYMQLFHFEFTYEIEFCNWFGGLLQAIPILNKHFKALLMHPSQRKTLGESSRQEGG